MTKLYHCDAPDCTNRPHTYKGSTLTYGRNDLLSGRRMTDDYHFCNAKCMVAFMRATESSHSDVLGHVVKWP